MRSASWLGREDDYAGTTSYTPNTISELRGGGDEVALRSLVLADRDEKKIGTAGMEEGGWDFDTRTYSSNSWSKWSESVTNGSTWLTSLSSIWSYASGHGVIGRRRKRRKSRSRSRGRVRRGRWGWKR